MTRDELASLLGFSRTAQVLPTPGTFDTADKAHFIGLSRPQFETAIQAGVVPYSGAATTIMQVRLRRY